MLSTTVFDLLPAVFAILSNPIVIILFAIAVFLVAKDVLNYQRSTYRTVTKNSYISVKFDAGKHGEYQIYKRLRSAEKSGAKFLFNVYVPKDNGETTEIDVLMITGKGVFVFESKNYSGWIFGSENQSNWYQTLPQGKGKSHKESFYNPILQNKGHIKHLSTVLGENIPMYSVIVFSERCTLKNITITSNNVKVIKRDSIETTVSNICKEIGQNIYSTEQITDIYNKLYPLTQVDISQKQEHIANIQKHKIESDSTIHKCPRCGGNLVLRTAKKGDNAGNQFYGCSNYPKCRYIEKAQNEVPTKEGT